MDTSSSGTGEAEKMIETTPTSSSARGVQESFRTFKPSTSLYIIQEESIVDIEFEKQASKINFQKMKAKVINEHPHKPNGIPYSLKDVLFKFKVGRHRLFSSSPNSDLDKFGVGVMLYFKLLKHLSFFFFLFILLSIPAYIFYVAAYVQYYDSTSQVDYMDVITSTTLGSIGMGSKACSLGRHPDYGTTDQAMLHFSCTDGNIADVSNINFGFVQLGSQCDYILQDDITTDCNNYDLANLGPAFADCDGKPYCQVPISKNLFKPKASSSYCDKIYKLMVVYMQITCISRAVEVKSHENPVLKSKIAYIVTTLDAVIVILFLAMIISLKYAQGSAVKNLLQKTYTASSYSVLINNLPQKSSQQETCAELWAILRNKLGQDQEDIIDVQVVPPFQLIEHMRSLEDLQTHKKKYVRKFIEHFMPDSNAKHLKQSQMKDVILKFEETEHPKLQKAQKILEKIQKLNMKQKDLKSKITLLETDSHPKLDTAFVTFNNIQTKNKILDILAPSFKFRNFFTTQSPQKTITARSVDEPGAIIWENIGAPKCSIFFRRSLSFLCALFLWGISATIITVSTYYQNDLSSKYPSINCQYYNPTKAEAANDYNLGDYQAGLIVCYCSADISARKYDVFHQVNDEQLCLAWFKNEVAIEVASWVIVFAIIIINNIVEFAFVALSNFEKHTSVTSKLSERTVKMFICEFLNTGLVILIINIKSSISWWQGEYNDLSPLWYSQVGSTIILALFLNAFSDPSLIVAKIIYQKTVQWIDRKFSQNRAVTRKKKQADYERLYTGPAFDLDTRYVQILMIVFVCFLYGSGMPLLYLTSFIQLIVTYLVDKYHLLKVCKTPEAFGHNLETVVRRAMYGAVLIHFPFAIFMFGESTLFVDGISTTSSSSTVDSIKTNAAANRQSVVQKFFKRAGYKYNSIFVVIFIVVVILYLFKILVHKFPLIKTIRQNIKKKYQEKVKTNTDSNNPLFLQLLTPTDIDVLIQTTKKDIKNVDDARLLSFLNKRLKVLEKALLEKEEEEASKNTRENLFKFAGSYSYDFRLNESTEEEADMRKIVSKISSKFL